MKILRQTAVNHLISMANLCTFFISSMFSFVASPSVTSTLTINPAELRSIFIARTVFEEEELVGGFNSKQRWGTSHWSEGACISFRIAIWISDSMILLFFAKRSNESNKKKIKNSFYFLRGREKTSVSIFHLRTPGKLMLVRSRLGFGLKFIAMTIRHILMSIKKRSHDRFGGNKVLK